MDVPAFKAFLLTQESSIHTFLEASPGLSHGEAQKCLNEHAASLIRMLRNTIPPPSTAPAKSGIFTFASSTASAPISTKKSKPFQNTTPTSSKKQGMKTPSTGRTLIGSGRRRIGGASTLFKTKFGSSGGSYREGKSGFKNYDVENDFGLPGLSTDEDSSKGSEPESPVRKKRRERSCFATTTIHPNGAFENPSSYIEDIDPEIALRRKRTTGGGESSKSASASTAPSSFSKRLRAGMGPRRDIGGCDINSPFTSSTARLNLPRTSDSDKRFRYERIDPEHFDKDEDETDAEFDPKV
ncbi:hypothetical protein B0O99DRAFT_687914 [Bisporella sp. PMI_857]|nr:hypothetical protein B0O99DRAFT_687914 [Bisporella sp. PMI_857]